MIMRQHYFNKYQGWVNRKRPRTEVGSIPAAKKGTTKGPLDILFYRSLVVKLEKGKQTNMKDGFSKKARETANQYIARFFFLPKWNCV